MSKQLPVLGFALIVALLTAQSSAQRATASLDATAAHDGYTMQWLLPTRSVGLFRPGLAIVLRPGAVMYEVNDRVELTDTPPVYENGDVLISSTLAARLARLASMPAAAGRYSGSDQPSVHVAQQPATGAITIDVHPVPGSEAVAVTGHAPPSAPVTITLLATISSDLPTVVVSRHDTQPDVNGNFQATISIAPNFVRNTYLRVLATSAAGSTPASAQITVGPPNAGQTVPLEYRPQDP